MSQADPLDDDVSLESKKRKAREEKDAEDKVTIEHYNIFLSPLSLEARMLIEMLILICI